MDGFPSGQRGQTVNLLAQLSKVRILLHPLYYRGVEQPGSSSGSYPEGRWFKSGPRNSVKSVIVMIADFLLCIIMVLYQRVWF